MSIMNKCRNCQIEIVDDTMICPLCKNVLEKSGEDEPAAPMYPEVTASTHVMKIIGRLYLFIAITCEAVLLLINYFTYTGVKWSLICGCVFLYCFLTLKYSLDNQNAGFRSKILTQSFALAALLVLIDHIAGYRGWSVNYAIPCIIIIMDVTILVVMLANLDFWQSYIIVLLVMAVASLVLLALSFVHVVQHPILSFVALGISVLEFSLSFILGGKKASNELRRKFYV